MFDKILIFSTVSVFSIIILTNFVSAKDPIDIMLDSRCNDSLPKEKADQYAICDSQMPQTIKDSLSKCSKKTCNEDGKFTKPDVCCLVVDEKRMNECFDKEYNELIKSEAKNKGVGVEETEKSYHRESEKFFECYKNIHTGVKKTD